MNESMMYNEYAALQYYAIFMCSINMYGMEMAITIHKPHAYVSVTVLTARTH